MPFEPRIYKQNADDAKPSPHGSAQVPANPVWNDAEELDLPDDLGMLAEQLRDDAAYLAQRHPADATLKQRELAWQDIVRDEQQKHEEEHAARKADSPKSASHSNVWRWVSAAAALSVVLGISSLVAIRSYEVTFPDVKFSWTATHQPAQSNPDGLQGSGVTSQHAASQRIGSTLPGNLTPRESNRPADDELPAEQPRLIPAALLRDVSAPELEGMLDLLEQDESGISI